MGYGIGLSGLKSASEAIDVTSNNISNAQTIGYKSGEYVFSDQFFRAQDPQSVDRTGMGAYRMAIRRTGSYGTVVNTQNPLDMAITGPGMFMLAKQVDGTVPTENPTKFQYTRNGQFAVDNKNRIVNENGMFLVGYPADSTGTIVSNQKSVMILDQKPMAQQATKNSTINLNLDNRGDSITGHAFNPSEPTSYSQVTSQTVYDDKGSAHTLSVYYKKVHSTDLTLTGDGTATTFTFDPKASLGTTLSGEQTGLVATSSNPLTATGNTETISGAALSYVSGGSEKLDTEIAALGGETIGTGYATTTVFRNVALTGGTGSGATATVTIGANGSVSTVSITNPGVNYAAGDILTVSGTALGTNNSDGSGFSIKVASLSGSAIASLDTLVGGSGYGRKTYDNVELTGGSGTGAKATIIVYADGSINHATLTSSGLGYQVGDLLGVPTTVGIDGTGFSVPVSSIYSNRVGVLGTITPGAGYTHSLTYSGVPLVTSSGTGSGATANVTVNSSGQVTAVSIVNRGSGYTTGSVLTVAASNLGNGAGSSFSFSPATVGDGTGGTVLGDIRTTGTITAGSGYGATTYSGVALTGGTGTGATANITVSAAGVVTNAVIVNRGSGYSANDVLSASGASIGNVAGSGFSIPVTSLKAGIKNLANATGVTSGGAGYTDGIYNDVPLTGGDGIGAKATITVSNGSIVSAVLTDGGSGYLSSNALSVNANSIGGTGSGFSATIAETNTLPGSGEGTRGSTYRLRLKDGTFLSLTQLTEAGNGTPKYSVSVDRYAVFGTLDGNPVGQDAAGNGITKVKIGGILTDEQTSLGTVAFVGGKNLDSLARDAFDKPQFDTQFKIDASGGAGTTFGKTTNGGIVQFTLKSTDMTAYSSAGQTYANDQDGSATSQLASYNVDSSGRLVAQYDNGKSVVKGQLILAYFNNLEGLIPNGNNTYEASAASGNAVLSFPGDGTLGAIRSKAVEQSNVDLTEELVRLMVLQRQYSAVSQATKVMAATLIDDAINIGR